jgi:hypothetical protein
MSTAPVDPVRRTSRSLHSRLTGSGVRVPGAGVRSVATPTAAAPGGVIWAEAADLAPDNVPPGDDCVLDDTYWTICPEERRLCPRERSVNGC